MQQGVDFCRALLIYGQIPCPPTILNGLLKNISDIYNHYQGTNEGLKFQERDHDVELMKLYKEKMDLFKE